MTGWIADFVYGDTFKTLAWQIKDRDSGALVDLTAATTPLVYFRQAGGTASSTVPTMGGALGTITFTPGAISGMDPGVHQEIKFEVWAEFDLSGKHYVMPDDGPDTITVLRLR
jgi:hypothetical protein